MNHQQVKVSSLNVVPIIDLPWIFRLVHLDQTSLPKGGYRFQATLFHDKASIAVTWIGSKVDDRLSAGCLVTPRWTSKTVCTQGQIIVIAYCLLVHQAPSIYLKLCHMSG